MFLLSLLLLLLLLLFELLQFPFYDLVIATRLGRRIQLDGGLVRLQRILPEGDGFLLIVFYRRLAMPELGVPQIIVSAFLQAQIRAGQRFMEISLGLRVLTRPCTPRRPDCISTPSGLAAASRPSDISARPPT